MKAALALLILSIVPVLGLSQDADQWKNYVDSGNEIWFQAPASVLIDRDSESKAITLHTFFDGVKLSVKKQEVKNEPLKYVKSLHLPYGLQGAKVTNLVSDKIHVRREDEMMGSDLQVTLHAGSKKSYFVVSLTAAPNNGSMKRVLQTLRFGGSRLYADPNIQDKPVNGEPVVFETLPSSLEADAALNAKPSAFEPAPKFDKIRDHVPLDLGSLSGDVIILRKPLPAYTDDARMRGVQGVIFVNVEFLANGTIGNIVVDDRADKGLGKNVMSAARKIKFIPAKANGRPIDATRTLFYRFAIY